VSGHIQNFGQGETVSYIQQPHYKKDNRNC